VAKASQNRFHRVVPCDAGRAIIGVVTGAMRLRPEGWAQPASASPDALMSRLATAQHGVVERRQLLALGLSGTTISRRVEDGHLHRVHRGVYAVGHPLLSRNGRWLAAVLACGPQAALSHASAAALWEIRWSDASLIDVTVPGTGARRHAGLRVHRARRLAPDEVVTRQGIPVTSAARTILDLAAPLSGRPLERLLNQAELEQVTDRPALAAVAARHPGHRGSGPLRRLLADFTAGTTITRTKLEERMLALCRANHLPAPRVNHHVCGIEVDFVFADARLLVEADSWAYHRTRGDFERDRERDAIFARAGYRVLRFADRQIMDEPGTVAATIATVLAG
jgi:very-short-patch-repair endonuclease